MDLNCGPILCTPFLNALIFLYETVAFEDLGIAIVLLTLTIRIVLFPIFHKSVKHQMLTQALQPEVKRIQESHKNDKQKQGEEILALYKKHGTNPFAGIGLILVQIPILFALFRVFGNILNPEITNLLYSFVEKPQALHETFLGLINLGEKSIVIVGLAAIAQFVQGKLGLQRRSSGSGETSAEKMAHRMVYIGPAITLIIFLNLPAAIGLYWFTSTLFSIGQQIVINRNIPRDGLETLRTKHDRTHGVPGMERRA